MKIVADRNVPTAVVVVMMVIVAPGVGAENKSLVREDHQRSDGGGGTATFVLRSGKKTTASLLGMQDGAFRVTAKGEVRDIPLDDVFMIDFTSDADKLPAPEVLAASDNTHLIVLVNGEVVRTRLVGVEGERQQRLKIEDADGTRHLPVDQVSRLYLRQLERSVGIEDDAPETSHLRGPEPKTILTTIEVPGNRRWVDTGVDVSKGESLVFVPRGMVHLSPRLNDVAGAAGAADGRLAGAGAPAPGLPAGALLFRIGDSAVSAVPYYRHPVDMPASGRLFLGINDGELDDNTGSFMVVIGKR